MFVNTKRILKSLMWIVVGQPEEDEIPPQPSVSAIIKNENEINKLELSINTTLKGNKSVKSH